MIITVLIQFNALFLFLFAVIITNISFHQLQQAHLLNVFSDQPLLTVMHLSNMCNCI